MAAAPGIKIGDRLNAHPSEQDLAFLQRMGVECATIWTTMEDAHYEYMIQMRRVLEERGIQLWNIGILDLHCDPTLVLGLPGFAQKVEQYKRYLRDLGRAGIG